LNVSHKKKVIMKKFKHKLEQTLVFLLPQSLYRGLGFIYEAMRQKKSFSQYGEDLIVKQYFDSIGLINGTYVDIGAYHPIGISNTHLLHKSGWTGYAVDIDKYKLSAFRLLRRGKCKVIFGAVTNEKTNGTEKINVYKFNRLWSEIDTLNLDTARKVASLRNFNFSKVEVPMLNVVKLFNDIGPVDLINIDIEGLDELVLLSINLEAIRPKVIIFEDNNFFGGSPKIQAYLRKNKYELLFKSAGSVGYHKEKN